MLTTFTGRVQQLQWLKDQFDLACGAAFGQGEAGPRLAVLIAESGHGKSRLVQELYRQLARSEDWNPTTSRYWPLSFADDEKSILVQPDLDGHQCGGLPKFLWVGVRWHPDYDKRAAPNPQLPPLLAALENHRLLYEHNLGLREAVRRKICALDSQEAVMESLCAAADLLVPGAGHAAKGIRTVSGLVQFLRERSAPCTHASIAAETSKNTTSSAIDALAGFCGKPHGLPVVIWLDDMQFAQGDDSLRRLLLDIMYRGVQEKWKVLVIVTCWESGWLDLWSRADDWRTEVLAQYRAQGALSEHPLPVEPQALCELLTAELPGLSTEDRQLILNKSYNNFDSLVRNLRELAARPRVFVGGDRCNELSDAGRRTVAGWSATREEAFVQRVNSLSYIHRDVLSLGARLGFKFVADVVADCAAHANDTNALGHDLSEAADESRSALAWCVDPGALLARPNEVFREFRDRAIYELALKEFNSLLEIEPKLLDLQRRYMAAWIGADVADDRLANPAGITTRPVDESQAWKLIQSGAYEAVRDALGIVIGELENDQAAGPAGEEPVDAVWPRAVLLAIINAARGADFDGVARHGAILAARWRPARLDNLLTAGQADEAADALHDAGAHEACVLLRDQVLRQCEMRAQLSSNIEDRVALARAEYAHGAALGASGRVAEAIRQLEVAARHCAAGADSWQSPLGHAGDAIAIGAEIMLSRLHLEQSEYGQAELRASAALCRAGYCGNDHPQKTSLVSEALVAYCDVAPELGYYDRPEKYGRNAMKLALRASGATERGQAPTLPLEAQMSWSSVLLVQASACCQRPFLPGRHVLGLVLPHDCADWRASYERAMVQLRATEELARRFVERRATTAARQRLWRCLCLKAVGMLLAGNGADAARALVGALELAENFDRLGLGARPLMSTLVLRARVDLADGKPKEARAHCRRVTKRGAQCQGQRPNTRDALVIIEAWNLLGRCYEETGKRNAARAAYGAAMDAVSICFDKKEAGALGGVVNDFLGHSGDALLGMKRCAGDEMVEERWRQRWLQLVEETLRIRIETWCTESAIHCPRESPDLAELLAYDRDSPHLALLAGAVSAAIDVATAIGEHAFARALTVQIYRYPYYGLCHAANGSLILRNTIDWSVDDDDSAEMVLANFPGHIDIENLTGLLEMVQQGSEAEAELGQDENAKTDSGRAPMVAWIAARTEGAIRREFEAVGWNCPEDLGGQCFSNYRTLEVDKYWTYKVRSALNELMQAYRQVIVATPVTDNGAKRAKCERRLEALRECERLLNRGE